MKGRCSTMARPAGADGDARDAVRKPRPGFGSGPPSTTRSFRENVGGESGSTGPWSRCRRRPVAAKTSAVLRRPPPRFFSSTQTTAPFNRQHLSPAKRPNRVSQASLGASSPRASSSSLTGPRAATDEYNRRFSGSSTIVVNLLRWPFGFSDPPGVFPAAVPRNVVRRELSKRRNPVPPMVPLP